MMKTLKFIQYLFVILIVLGCYECHKAENSIETIDPSKVYTGTIIAQACAGSAVIHVTNANIGEDWKPGTGLYKNIIAISNCPDSIKTNNTISFNLIDNDNYRDPCAHLMDIAIYSNEKPLKIYGVNNIKKFKK